MNISKPLAGIGAAAAVALAALPAGAATITFETAPSTGSYFAGPITESGFTYAKFGGYVYIGTEGNPNHDMEAGSGTGGGIFTIKQENDLPFLFNGLDYAAYNSRGTGSQSLQLQALRNGEVVGFTSFILDNTAIFDPSYGNYTTFGAGSLDGITIDKLFIKLDAYEYGDNRGAFQQAVDNVRLTALEPVVIPIPGVPEPAIWGMLTMGFGGIGAVLRRCRGQLALRA